MAQADRGGAADPGRAAGDENRIHARSADHDVTPFWLLVQSLASSRGRAANAAGHRRAPPAHHRPTGRAPAAHHSPGGTGPPMTTGPRSGLGAKVLRCETAA